MADITTGIYSGVFPGLGAEPSLPDGFRDWLVKGTYACSAQSTETDIVLENVDRNQLISYINFDFERFCFASWESFRGASAAGSASYAAWPLLEAYYSGFFAAHSIMRALGEGIVKLERSQASFLTQVLALHSSAAPVIKPGMYAYQLGRGPGARLTVRLVPHLDGGGVHEGFWKAFAAFLNRHAELQVSKNLPDAALFVAGVSEITPMLTPDAKLAGAVWFSATRNEVNYQQRHRVWLFDQKKKISDYVRSLRQVPSRLVSLAKPEKDDPVAAFAALAHFLACLNWELAERVAGTSSRPRSFGTKWRKLNAILRQG